MNNKFKKSIEDKVLKKIKRGKLKMRPKSYFILKTTLFVIGVILAFVFIIFLISFIIFILRASGAGYFPAFGFRGIRIFLVSFPWLLLIFAILFVVILEIFARKFSAVYKKPLIYSVLGIIIISLLLGIVVAQTPMHKTFLKDAQKGKLPIMKSFYQGRYMKIPDNTYIGRVSDFTDDGFIIETKKGEVFSVIISSKTHLVFERDIEKDDWVMVVGEKSNLTIEALKIIMK